MSASNVFEWLFDASQPFVVPQPWDFLPSCACYRTLPQDRAALLRDIAAEFPAENLLQAGIAERDDDGNLRLHRLVAESKSPILGIRGQLDEPLTGLMVEMQYFGTASIAGDHLVRIVRQQQTTSLVVPEVILLAESMVDAAIFASQGIVTLPVRPLVTLDPLELREILDLQFMADGICSVARDRQRRSLASLDMASANTKSTGTPVTKRLVVPGFDAADFSSTRMGVDESLVVLRELIHLFPKTPWNFGLWRPSEASRDVLNWQMRRDLPAQRVSTVQKSLQADCMDVRQIGVKPASPHDRLQFATQLLNQLDTRGANATEKTQVWRQLIAWQEEARIRPLRLQAQATDDPLYRAQLEVLADMASMALPQMQAEIQRLRLEAEQLYLHGANSYRDHQASGLVTRNVMQVMNKYTSTLKDTISCTQKRARRKTKNSSPAGQRDSRFRRPRSPR